MLKDGSLFTKEEYDPIHVRDLVILTNRYTKEREEQLQCNYITNCWEDEPNSTLSDSDGRVDRIPEKLAGTRPDICYAVSQVAKFNDCFGREHWKAVLRIFRYLKT